MTISHLKRLKIAFLVIIFTTFIFNSCQVIYRMMYPELPTVHVYEKNLKDIQFPISFTVCLYEIENSVARYQKLGYYHVGWFFTGISSYNSSISGFRGHTEDGGILSTKEGIKNWIHSFIDSFKTIERQAI